MIKYVDSDKSLKVPRNLGNYPQSSVTGGTTPEEVQRMIDASLEDYTLTDDFATINGRPITEGGNIEVSGGTPTQVTVTQVVTGGTKIATIGVDGTETDLYAPASGGGVTPQDVQDAIDQALQDYPTSAVTQDLDERVTELENDSVDYATTADTQALETAISGKSTVVWNQIATGGTKVAEITVDGTKTDVYAPQGGGVTPQDVQDAIDSALTPYSTTLQIETMLEDKQDTLTPGAGIQISGNTISATGDAYVIDLRVVSGMTTAEKQAVWDEAYANAVSGNPVYMVGLYSNNATVLHLLEYSPVTNPSTHGGGNMRFWGKVYTTANNWFRIQFNSDGGGVTSAYLASYSIYELPTASSSTKGGIKVGSGLTIDAQGVLSVSGGSSTYDGYVWTTDAEYDAMTQAEKEAWYDNIISGATDGNYKFGIIVTTEPWNPEEHQDLNVKCRSLRFCWVEDGYDSLHFNDANYSDNNFRGMEYRVARGGTWDRIDEKNLDITKFTENENDRRMFTITTGLTAYGYFDCYMLNRCFSEPHQSWDFYSAVGSMPLRIVSPHQDNPDEFDLVCTANILACGEAPSGLYQDGYAKRFVFRYFLNGELYEAVMDSVSGGSGDGLHVIHNYSVYGNWVGTQADYNAIGAGNYDSKVIYHIDR